MRLKAIMKFTEEQTEAIMRESGLKTGDEVVALLRGYYLAEAPNYADQISFEVLEESEDTE